MLEALNQQAEHALEDKLIRLKPNTALSRHKSLFRFFGHLVEIGEISRSPVQLLGWSTHSMLRRYGSKLAWDWALATHRRLSPGGRL
jgi:hypothetical protein